MLSQYFDNNKDKIDFYIAITVIALAGAMILYYSFGQDLGTSFAASEKSEKPKELKIEGHNYLALEEEEELIIKNKKPSSQAKVIEQAPVAVAATSAVHQTKTVPEIIPEHSDLDEILEAPESVPDEDEMYLEDEDELTNPIDTGILDTSAIAEMDLAETEEAVTEKMAPIPSDKRCIILLGAYSSKRGIQKLTKKLEAEGYVVFKTPYKGLTRVGVYHTCDSSIFVKRKELRKKYAADAFILKGE